MKNLKKVVVLALTVVLGATLFACGGSSEESPSDMDITVKSVTFEAPKAFTEASSNVWQTSTGSNIIATDTAKDAKFDDYKESDLKSTYEDTFKKQYNVDVDIEIKGFEYTTVAKFNAIRVESAYTLQGVKIHQVQYMIDADKSYIYTLTNVGDDDYVKEFEDAVKAIKIDYEEN